MNHTYGNLIVTRIPERGNLQGTIYIQTPNGPIEINVFRKNGSLKLSVRAPTDYEISRAELISSTELKRLENLVRNR